MINLIVINLENYLKNSKSFILLSLLILFSSCGDRPKSESSNSASSDGDKTQSNLTINGELETQYSVKEIVQCALVDIERNRLTPLNFYSRRLRRRTQERLDAQIPEVLTKSIVNDLRSKSQQTKLTPSKFWSLLDVNLERKLSQNLINNNVLRSEKAYRQLQQDIAFAFSVYIENETGIHGYRLLSKDEDGKVVITKIGFSENTTGIKVIRPCDNFDTRSIFIPSGLRSPKNITAKILCENRNGEKLSISGSENSTTNEEEIWVNLVSNHLKDNFRLVKDKLNITKDSRKSRTLLYNSNEVYNYRYLKFDISKKSSNKPDSIKRIELTAYKNNGEEVKVKKLKCTTLKELKLP